MKHGNRIVETTSTTGTGTYTRGGAVDGYQPFSELGVGETCHYLCKSGATWEIGLGTVTSTGLERTQILDSSTGAAIDWPVGDKTLIQTLIGETLDDVLLHVASAHAPSDANNYIHPTNHPPSVITQDASNRFVTDIEKSTWNGKEAGGAVSSHESNHPAPTNRDTRNQIAGSYEPANANIQSHVTSSHAPATAEQNVQSDWNAVSGDALILNKPTTISAQQAADISTNNAKISFDSTTSTRLANTSGTNTGDQDLSSYVLSSSLGTASTVDIGTFATAAQGALADSALQSFTETDPVFTAWNKSTGISITESQISDLGDYEGNLGDPTTDDYLLSSKQDGTRSWVPTPSSLPDQTDNSGKYLTTDGTDASWAEIASNAVNIYDTSAGFPATGEADTLYIAKNTNLIYRWDAVYVLIGETPTTVAPVFSQSTISVNEMSTISLTINNYNAAAAYTIESLDASKATVSRSGSSFVISTKHVEANTSVSVRIKATAPEFHTSEWTTLTVNITTITFYADDAIQVTDFTDEALYSTNWSLL